MSSSIAAVTGYLQSFSRNDPDAIAGFVSDGFRNEHQSALGTGCAGREAYRRRLPHFLDSFADRSYSIEDIVEQQRESCTDVVVQYRFRARYDDTDIDIPGVMWFSVRDGLITRRIDTWDSLDVPASNRPSPTERLTSDTDSSINPSRAPLSGWNCAPREPERFVRSDRLAGLGRRRHAVRRHRQSA